MEEQQRVFIGFDSTVPTGERFDEDLVIVDLLNHVKTRKGERVMNPEYGSIIWDLLFEPKSDFIKNEIERDLIRIIQSEPRVQLLQLQIIEIEHGYIGQAELFFLELNQIKTLEISFNSQLSTNLTQD